MQAIEQKNNQAMQTLKTQINEFNNMLDEDIATTKRILYINKLSRDLHAYKLLLVRARRRRNVSFEEKKQPPEVEDFGFEIVSPPSKRKTNKNKNRRRKTKK